MLHGITSMRVVNAVRHSPVLLAPTPPAGELTATALTTGASQNTDAVTTASLAPVAAALLLLWVTQTHGVATVVPIVSGLGLTWEFVVTAIRSPAGPRRISLFRAVTAGSPPTPGALNLDLTDSATNVMWSVIEHTGVDLSEGGANALAQVVTASAADFELGASVTLSSSMLAGSGTVGGLMAGADEPLTFGAGYTKLSETNIGVSTNGSFYQAAGWREDFATLMDVSWLTPAHWVMIGAELAAA